MPIYKNVDGRCDHQKKIAAIEIDTTFKNSIKHSKAWTLSSGEKIET